MAKRVLGSSGGVEDRSGVLVGEVAVRLGGGIEAWGCITGNHQGGASRIPGHPAGIREGSGGKRWLREVLVLPLLVLLPCSQRR